MPMPLSPRRLASRLGACALAALALAMPAAAAELPESVEAEIFDVGEGVYVRALAMDEKRGSVWVGTSVGALQVSMEKKEPVQILTRKEGLANEYVFAIGVGPDDSVWFGTNGGGVSRWMDGVWKTWFPMHGLADYWVYAFAWDKDDKVWIGTWDGANHYDATTDEWITYHDELINIWVYGLDIDDDGKVWLGTEGGVSMYDKGEWSEWSHDDGLGAANRQGLPPSENTGLGTRERHDLSIFVNGQESFNPNYVFASKVDATGRGIWFGTWGGGASLFDGTDTWTNYTTQDGLPGNVVYSIAQSEDGIMWFGTNNGVVAYDGETFKPYPIGHRRDHVYSLAVAPDGAIWAGTRGAVMRLAPAK